MNTHSDVKKEGEKIEEMKKIGLETETIMKLANKDLRSQREDIIKIKKVNDNITTNIDRADRMMKEISMKDFY